MGPYGKRWVLHLDDFLSLTLLIQLVYPLDAGMIPANPDVGLYFFPAEIVNGCLLKESSETTGAQVSSMRYLAKQIHNPAQCALACQDLEECVTFMFYGSRYCHLRTAGKLVLSEHAGYTSGWCPKGKKANLLHFEKGEKILVKIFYKKIVKTTQQQQQQQILTNMGSFVFGKSSFFYALICVIFSSLLDM